MALKNKKIPEGRKIDPALADAIGARLKAGRLDCAAAFALAKQKGTSPLAVGEAADSLGVRLGRCQLGLFGFPGRAKAWECPGWKQTEIPAGLESALRSAIDPDGSLSCAAAWIIADRSGIRKAQIGFLANRLNIQIKRCQLGAF